jgi:transposase
MVLDGQINGDWFEAYAAQVLLPELDHGDIVVMDNLSSHQRASVRGRVEAAGATPVLLPPYNPDFNPIEKAFSRQGHAAKGGRADHLRPLGSHRQDRRSIPALTNAPTASAPAATNRSERKPLKLPLIYFRRTSRALGRPTP